ncbi:MAG: hypothetical protein LC708_00170, partial [Actinobacteria bacterium]|nr:hypothetical protein [Actinomycetota bacterium]
MPASAGQRAGEVNEAKVGCHRYRRGGAARRALAVALVCSAMLLAGLGQGSAQADVTVVSGSAYGYS